MSDFVPFSQKELDQFTCDHSLEEDHECCSNDLLEVFSRCHPAGAIRVIYQRSMGVLHVVCFECDEEIAQILVAEHGRS